ncbi:hypothetical protein J7K42_02665 [bacterium]|nr:hypothetical protein [bacterium]
MRKVNFKNLRLVVIIIMVAFVVMIVSFCIFKSSSTPVAASGRFNLPLTWILTNSGTSVDTNNDGIIDRERLPFEQGDITSDVDSNTWDLGYYDVANLIPGNVKLDISFGRNQTGTLAPEGTATAGDVCNSKTFYSGGSWTQKTGTRAPSDCGYIPDTWSGVCIYKTGDVSCPSEYPNKHTRQVCTACTSCTGSCQGCNSCTSPSAKIKMQVYHDSHDYYCVEDTWISNYISGDTYLQCGFTGTNSVADICRCWYYQGSSCTGSCKGCDSCTGSLTSCTTYTYCCQ